jgi:diguanylate cyclase (GGDEF)-like protein
MSETNVKRSETFQWLEQFWSTTSFSSKELTDYAAEKLVEETRRGVMVMSLLMLGLILAALLFYMRLGLNPIYVYAYCLVGILAGHVYLSARTMAEIKVLYLLGITLLTISASAFVSIAHQTNSFSILLFANIVLLFMAVPIVPWGLREAGAVILIIYFMFTLSTGGVAERFNSDTLWVLQFLMLAAGVMSIVQVARSVRVRKDDISARFDLEQARAHLYQLSNIDPLTGAWNRRFLTTALARLVDDYGESSQDLHYALFDIDDFKQLNDSGGHEFGDQVLQFIGGKFAESLDGQGHLVRLGGDEFALLLVQKSPHEFIDCILKAITEEFADSGNLPVSMSYGLASAPLGADAPLDELYVRADEALYRSKRNRKIT